MHVLLIEDNKAVAEMIKLLLAGKGFNIAVADCGEDGIDLAKRYNYDIIILDLQLPDISGLQVLRTLRSAAIATPVMVLSGNMVVDAKVKALGIGADDYLTKPFHKDELIARIQAVVRRSKGHAQSLITTGKLSVNLDSHRRGERRSRPRHRAGIPDPRIAQSTEGCDLVQRLAHGSSLWRHGRARSEDHRCVHLQTSQEARGRLRR